MSWNTDFLEYGLLGCFCAQEVRIPRARSDPERGVFLVGGEICAAVQSVDL